MKKKGVSLIMGLMSVSLLGVIAMQVYFFRESYRLKTELFDQSVHEALSSVVSGLEKHRALYYIRKGTGKRRMFADAVSAKRDTLAVAGTAIPTKKHTPKPTDPRSERQREFRKMLLRDQKKADSLFDATVSRVLSRFPKYKLMSKIPLLTEDEEPKIQIHIEESGDRFGNVTQQAFSRVIPGSAVVLNRARVGSAEVNAPGRRDTAFVFYVRDSMGRDLQLQPFTKRVLNALEPEDDEKLDRQLQRSIARAKAVSKATVKKMVDSAQIRDDAAMVRGIVRDMNASVIPFRKRIQPLDSLLRAELTARGIRIAYKTVVDSSATPKGVFFSKASDRTEKLPDNVYQASLFPGDFSSNANGTLTLIFPDKNNVILSAMGVTTATSAALALVLILCFGYTLHSILRQKKVSEMKTDFINNMTHEFKTPVATIMIASEGLKDPDVAVDKGRVNRLAGIIYDENVRLANHIERVLNIAKIDRQDLKLEHAPIEMNELITAVTDSMALQLQKREATLTLNLEAEQQIVEGDELHLSNVIYNLVDNAIKYSVGAPDISITTLNSGKNFVVKVADKGIGMNRDQLSKIFEQFYRVPTGNLHDVKGFGLGLSYVNNIVKKLGGSVKVKSEKDKGSEFELTFPTL